MSERMSEDMSEDMTEEMSIEMSEDMSKDMSEEMSKREVKIYQKNFISFRALRRVLVRLAQNSTIGQGHVP